MNKPEPLKGKWDVYDNNVPEKCKPCLKTMLVRQAKDDVRSAVEWLRVEAYGCDLIDTESYDEMIKLLDEAFENVMSEGKGE